MNSVARRALASLPLLLFFASGAAALIYETVWVREFGRFLGNTSRSAALVTGLFVGGLGIGSFLVGRMNFLKSATGIRPLWKAYAVCEALIGLAALVTLAAEKALPRFLPSSTASYHLNESGFWGLTPGSILAQLLVLALLILPTTVLMGATLPLLLRITRDSDVSNGWRFGLLYGANTAGAMVGCLLVDLLLVPSLGSWGTQVSAIGINFAIGLAAWLLSLSAAAEATPSGTGDGTDAESLAPVRLNVEQRKQVGFAFATVAVSGFMAMGVQVIWARFLATALGGTRGVFSLLLAVILGGMWFGSVAGGAAVRRWQKPWAGCVIGSWLFLASAMFGFLWFDRALLATGAFARFHQDLAPFGLSWLADVFFVLRAVVPVAGLASFWAGFTIPPAIELLNFSRFHESRLTSVAYMINCVAALLGALLTGFWFLPSLGMQASLLLLACPLLALAGALVYVGQAGWPKSKALGLTSAGAAVCLLAYWGSLSPQYLLLKMFDPPRRKEGFLALSEDVVETIAVDEHPVTKDRYLMTNGHPMSGTALGSVRYMRMFSHLPLLQVKAPTDALVICFGVGNTLHAASLYPSLQRLHVVDLSSHVLQHAHFFKEWNRDVLKDPRVQVFINDGRHHLQMQPSASYDLVTLEPPPLAHAGVANLYTREFYELARSRLKPGGFLTTWLPALQLTEPALRSAVRAFIDVFPNGVMLHGHADNFVLMGRAAETNTIDFLEVQHALSRLPEVRADLDEVYLGTMTELFGSFVASSDVLQRFSRPAEPLTDDRPSMDYGYISFLRSRIPPDLIGTMEIEQWCPGILNNSPKSSYIAGELPTYLAIMDNYYRTIPPIHFLQPRPPHRLTLDLTASETARVIGRSGYLQGVLRAQLSEMGVR